jgi:class 3 adenylate cyclase
MDRHELPGVTAPEVAEAHRRDLEVQDKYGVRYITYWFDAEAGAGFCLIDAPDKEAAETVHRESHGLVASRIIEVDPQRVSNFLGSIEEPEPGEPIANSGLRAILFTDIEGSTSLTQQLGDEKAMEVLRAHNSIVRQALQRAGGREVKHTGDGIMACFHSVVAAARCSVEIQQQLDGETPDRSYPTRVRVGMTAGEPVTEDEDLFGAAVNLAARICAASDPGGILASNVVRELSLGKGFRWNDVGPVALKGFEEPVSLYELLWRDGTEPAHP